MVRLFALILLGLPVLAHAQGMRSSYATTDGRADTVVISCPSQDGSFKAGPCLSSPVPPVTYTGPVATAITTANVAVTVFAAGSIVSGCDVVNTGTGTLYLDLTTTAVIGAATAIPLQPGQAYHCPFAPAGPVSAVAAQMQGFVAVRY